MNILYLAHRIPYPPNKGDKIRAFHQIQDLSRTHAIHLACLVDEKQDLEHVKALEQFCVSIDVVYWYKTVARLLAGVALATGKPLSVAAFYSKELQEKIDQRVRKEKVDMIFVFSSSMAEYVHSVHAIPKVMDFVDVDSEKWLLYADYHAVPVSWIYRLEAKRLARYEEKVARRFEHSIFVSEKEAALFQQRIHDRPISVIPNGVDLDYFSSNGAGLSLTVPPVMVFTGVMDYLPNVDAVQYFCSEIFPLVRKILPEAQFYIVGRNPVPQVRELSHQPNVVVTGSVADIRPYLAKAGVAVAPFRIARGVQNKVLEAMAMGLPVVGTTIASQGIKATEADGIRIADHPAGFAHAICALLKDAEARHQCGLQARRYVEQHHRWQEHGAALHHLLQVIAERPVAHNDSRRRYEYRKRAGIAE